MDDRIVADQWSCDLPLRGSQHQEPHVDYRRPLFAEATAFAVILFGVVGICGLAASPATELEVT